MRTSLPSASRIPLNSAHRRKPQKSTAWTMSRSFTPAGCVCAGIALLVKSPAKFYLHLERGCSFVAWSRWYSDAAGNLTFGRLKKGLLFETWPWGLLQGILRQIAWRCKDKNKCPMRYVMSEDWRWSLLRTVLRSNDLNDISISLLPALCCYYCCYY